MKKMNALLGGMIISISSSALASPFEINLTPQEISKRTGILTVGDLAVAEKGLISISGFNTCLDQQTLKIPSMIKLESRPSEYINYLEVTRTSGETIDVLFTNRGKKAETERLSKFIFDISVSPQCAEYVKLFNSSFLTVGSINSASNLSGLLTKIESETEAKDNEKSATDTEDNTPSIISEWRKFESKSPLDDTPEIILIKKAEDSDAGFFLRCKGNTTDVFISTSDFLGDNSKKAIIRFDNQKPSSETLSLSTDNKGLFFPSPVKFIKKILDVDTLVIGFKTFRNEPRVLTIKLEGLKDNISALREACNW